MADRPPYRHGRIVWVYLRSSVTGKREHHPAVIIDRDEDITQPEQFDPRTHPTDNLVYVVGISTKYRKYNLPCVRLPHSGAGHSLTMLREDCAAIIGWYHRLAIPDDVIGFGGDVPA